MRWVLPVCEVISIDEYVPGHRYYWPSGATFKQRHRICSHPRCQRPAVLVRVADTGDHLKCWAHAGQCGMKPMLHATLFNMVHGVTE